MDGGLLTLDSDCTESVTVPAGKKLTIDLGGHTWTGVESKTALTVIGADITLKNGTIAHKGTKTIQVGGPDATERSTVTLASSLTVKNEDYCAVFVGKNAYLYTSADIVAEGKEATCIQGNDLAAYFDNYVSVEGGTLTATGTDAPVAIYWPQRGDLTIKGGRIESSTAVEFRGGNLKVLGGELVGTGHFTVSGNGNGSTTDGAAIAVAQHTTQLPITVSVSGGTFTAEVPFSEANPQNNPITATNKIQLSITGGTFTSTAGYSAVVSADCKGFVSGGTFSLIDNAYISPASSVKTEGGIVTITAKSMAGVPMFISDNITEGTVSSTRQGVLIGSFDSMGKLPADAAEGTLAYCREEGKYYKMTGGGWAEDVPKFSALVLDASEAERPASVKAVLEKTTEIDNRLADRYTKSETDSLLGAKQGTIVGAASTITDKNLDSGLVLISNSSGKVGTSTITTDQLDRLGSLDTTIEEMKGNIDSKVGKTEYDAKVKQIDDALTSTDTKISALDKKVDTKQGALRAGDNITIDGNNKISAVIPDAVKPDEALSTTSENAVMNKTIAARFNATDAKFGSYLTKTDAASTYLGKDATAVKASRDAKGNVIDETYALKGDLTSLYKLMGTCTSAELDGKDKTVGHVWNLSDEREYDGKTFKAGTSWLCEYDGTGAQVWEPQTPLFDVDLSGVQKKSILLPGVTVAEWEDLGEAETYRYRGKLGDTKISAADTATVTFGIADAISGDYAPVCDTDDEKLYIYSKKNNAVTLALVEIRKG